MAGSLSQVAFFGVFSTHLMRRSLPCHQSAQYSPGWICQGSLYCLYTGDRLTQMMIHAQGTESLKGQPAGYPLSLNNFTEL